MAASVSVRGARRFTTLEGGAGNNSNATKKNNNNMTININSNKSAPNSASYRAVQAVVTVQRAFRSTLQVPHRHDTVPPHACINDVLETAGSVLGKTMQSHTCDRRMWLSKTQHCFGHPQGKRLTLRAPPIEQSNRPRCCPTNRPKYEAWLGDQSDREYLSQVTLRDGDGKRDDPEPSHHQRYFVAKATISS